MNYEDALLKVLEDEESATGVIRFTDPAAAIPILAGVVPGEASPPPLTFQESGYALRLYGQERLGTAASFATTELRLMINGTRDVITQGALGGAFFPFLGLFGPNLNWFKLRLRVNKGDVWQPTYRNFGAVVANPVCGVAFASDAKVDAMVKQLMTMGR